MKQEKNKAFENQTIIAYNDRFDKEKKRYKQFLFVKIKIKIFLIFIFDHKPYSCLG